MNLRIKLRLIGLATAIGLMGLMIVVTTVKSQRRAGELRKELAQVDSESFQIADEFKNFLRLLNSSMYRYGSEHNRSDLETFRKASHDLDLWIDGQKPKLASESEKILMQQIDASYDVYLRTANELQTRLQAADQSKATLDDYRALLKDSQHLFDLGQALSKAHYQSRGLLVARANQTITDLRILVLISLGGLFVFGLVLALVVYRDMIAPLRVKLVESQALAERQEKLASLGLLAAGVAHEIRNPLTAIKAALFIQQKRFQPETQELADAKIVEREIMRLERIVNDFLLFARPTDPELVVVRTDVSLQEVHTLLAPELTRKKIELILEKSPPLRIRADASQIKQVLINLVRNSADAIEQSGVIKLRVRADRKRLAQADSNVVVLEVEDNGRGIPPEVQKRLFDPFFTTKEAGTGLGLSIAAAIVQKHGGTIQYQTQMHYGTTFGIILPQAMA
jgi:signal transduction histidine kinase